MGSISSTHNPWASSCHRMTSPRAVWDGAWWCDMDSPRIRRLMWRRLALCAAPRRPLILSCLVFLSPTSCAHPGSVYFPSPHCLSYRLLGGLSFSPCDTFPRGASTNAHYASLLGFVATPLPSESQFTDSCPLSMLIRLPGTVAMRDSSCALS